MNKYSFEFTIEQKGTVKFHDGAYFNQMPGGFYEPIHIQNRRAIFKSRLENLVELNKWSGPYFPMEQWNRGLMAVDHIIDVFFSSEKMYRGRGLPFRRNLLMHGDTGTGKSYYIHQKCRQLIDKHDAIVIKISNYNRFTGFYRFVLDKLDLIRDRIKVIILEDVEKFWDLEDRKRLSEVLNHHALKHKTLVIMSSTTPQDISERILKSPSLINQVIGVFNHDFLPGFIPAWYNFIYGEDFPEEEIDSDWYKQVEGRLSPVYLKELFLNRLLQGHSFQKGWEDLKARKNELNKNFGKEESRLEELFNEQIMLDLKRALEE